MKCSQCQNEVLDSAAFCPSCGSTIASDAPKSFSYLPAGIPPWPTTVPSHFSSHEGAPALTANTSQAASGGKSGRSALGVALTSALLILTPLLAAGLTLGVLYFNGQFTSADATPVRVNVVQSTAQTPTPSAQNNLLPTPSAFRKASSADVNISLRYPADWVTEAPQKSSDSTFFGIHPAQQNGIGMIFGRYSTSSSSVIKSPNEINQQNVSALGSSQSIHDVQTVPAPSTAPTIGGTKWTEQDITFSDGNGNKIRFATLTVEYKQQYYNIAVFVPDMYYSEAMQKYIQPMLDSFAFLS